MRIIELSSLTVWVYSNSAGADKGGGCGDVYYISVCGQAIFSRVALPDVSGHGAEVSAPAKVLHALMRQHINMLTVESCPIVLRNSCRRSKVFCSCRPCTAQLQRAVLERRSRLSLRHYS
jgi:hypothetical protein